MLIRILAYKFEKEDNQCLTDLRLTDPRDDKTKIQDRKDQLLKDSYIWILDHQDFINWQDDNETRLLWIKGDPGKGKTMLLIGIVEELSQQLKSMPGSGLLSYFFCQGTDSKSNNATAVLRGLIYLLLDQQPSLISHIREKYDKAGRQLFDDPNAFYALSKVFTDMLHDPRLARVYLIVDALDECIDVSIDESINETKPGLSQLLDLIVQNASTSSTQVKWLVSSRNRNDIKERLSLIDGQVKLSLELNSHCVSSAVDAYINHKVSELTRLKQYDDRLQDEARSYLRETADGTFLWVALVCKQLRHKNTHRWKTLSVLKAFPQGLQPLYMRMIEQMRIVNDEEDVELCRRILASITVAYRPIHLKELTLAAGLPEKFSDDLQSLEELVELCGSFLIIKKEVIYFVHQSAKDYLSTNACSEIFPRGCTEIHRGITSRSLQVMSERLRRDIYNLQKPGTLIDQVGPVDPDPLAQVRYSCVYWVDHLYEIDNISRNQVGLYDGGTIHLFLKEHFLHWMEALSLMRSMSNAVTMVGKLENLLRVSF